MNQWLADPNVQQMAVPALVAFAAVAVLGIFPGRLLGTRGAAAAAIPLGFLAAYWLMRGWPPFPPVGATQKIAYVVAFGTALGAYLDLFARSVEVRYFGSVAGPAAIIAWLHWRGLNAAPLMGFVVPGALWLAGMAVFSGMQRSYSNEVEPVLKLSVAALGASLIAEMGSSILISQLLMALAAAAGGFILWNWPRNRFMFGDAGLFGGTAAFLALTTVLVLFSHASKPALAILVLVFYADRLTSRSRFGSRFAGGPVQLGIVCLVLAGVAVLVARYYH